MGHFYNPPQPIVSRTGAQPSAPNKLPPSTLIVPEPPHASPMRQPAIAQQAAIQAQPDPWQYNSVGSGFSELQPYGKGQLPPSLLIVPNPPFVLYGSDAWLNTTIQAWQPPDPQPFTGDWQPLAPRKLSPGIPGQSVDSPPPANEGRYPNATPDVIARSWQPPDPPPTLPRNLAPGVPGQSVDNPPLLASRQMPLALDVPWPQPQVKLVPSAPPVTASQPYAPLWMSSVLSAWQAGDAPPTIPRLLNASFLAVPVDNPPFGMLEVYPDQSRDGIYYRQPFLRQVRRTGTDIGVPFVPPVTSTFVPYTTFWMGAVTAWSIQPDPPPTLPRNLNPQLLAVPVDNPPFGLLVTVVEPWIGQDPLPTVPRFGIPLGVQANNPPFSYFARTAQLQAIITLWQPPDPPPVQRGPLNPSILTVAVNNPPFTYSARTAQQNAILAAWQPPDPQPTQRGPLNPTVLAVAVNNPPFSGRSELPNIIAQWQPPPPQPWVNYLISGSNLPPGPPLSTGIFTVSGRDVIDLFGDATTVSNPWSPTQKRTN